jgi:hypothetical protein
MHDWFITFSIFAAYVLAPVSQSRHIPREENSEWKTRNKFIPLRKTDPTWKSDLIPEDHCVDISVI